jgi:hypothetical protein
LSTPCFTPSGVSGSSPTTKRLTNHQKHLQKSTKVDAEYNLPTWVPKTRVNNTKWRIPGAELRVHHVSPRGPHSTSIRTIINWSCAKNRHEVGLRDSGNIRGTFRAYSGNIRHVGQPQVSGLGFRVLAYPCSLNWPKRWHTTSAALSSSSGGGVQ